MSALRLFLSIGALFTLAAEAATEPTVLFAPIEKIFEASLAEPIQIPKGDSDQLEAHSLNVEDILDQKFEPGEAFGSVGQVLIDASLEDVVRLFHNEKSIDQLIQLVPTLKDVVALQRELKENSITMRVSLKIKVPIVADFIVPSLEMTFNSHKSYADLRWSQTEATEQIKDNRGFVILRPIDSKHCLASVYGIHVMQPNHRVGWFFRSSARSFTTNHYRGFLTALQKFVKKEVPSGNSSVAN